MSRGSSRPTWKCGDCGTEPTEAGDEVGNEIDALLVFMAGHQILEPTGVDADGEPRVGLSDFGHKLTHFLWEIHRKAGYATAGRCH